MKQVDVRFYAQLNDFLPPETRMKPIRSTFHVSGSVKDLVEALGVPHTEVDLILVNGEPVTFAYRLQNNDRISVYPRFRNLDISPLAHLHPQSQGEPRFVADTHLGRLAAYLRMLGFDTLYASSYHDEEMARLSAVEDRVLLTRDRGLLKRTIVSRGYFIRTPDPVCQLVAVIQEFDLLAAIMPFRRCMHCNALLRPIAKESVSHRLLPRTKEHFDEYYICPHCDRVYWKGSHYGRMRRLIESVT